MLSKRGMSREAEGRQMYEKGRKRYYRRRRILLHNFLYYTIQYDDHKYKKGTISNRSFLNDEINYSVE